ncbi:hypothetical protein BLL42_27870 (plasmid) [Pseudomonas frederiksbergensis]|uniref:Uncharacterized protein n=1 Tax=Pseudomonas frederiksbergensis TaxID=104087 RepID=A0A1J0EUT0_9PSED|nr:hypothetical protein [Pseudomonas frederiksbergensis]APC19540.1 hypothetical protein BLL42_27870 [Pseudomonas frederiksbergensis]
MAQHCLICDSTVVASKDVTTTVVILIGTLENFLLGVTEVQAPLPENEQHHYLAQMLARISKGVSRATSGYIATQAFANDVQKYQFSHYDYLCLRCGTLFDQDSIDNPHDL